MRVHTLHALVHVCIIPTTHKSDTPRDLINYNVLASLPFFQISSITELSISLHCFLLTAALLLLLLPPPSPTPLQMLLSLRESSISRGVGLGGRRSRAAVRREQQFTVQ